MIFVEFIMIFWINQIHNLHFFLLVFYIFWVMNATAIFQLILYMVFLSFSIMSHIQILIALYILLLIWTNNLSNLICKCSQHFSCCWLRWVVLGFVIASWLNKFTMKIKVMFQLGLFLVMLTFLLMLDT
jgi:hypothetical protein